MADSPVADNNNIETDEVTAANQVLLSSRIEALLMVSDKPLSSGKIADLLGIRPDESRDSAGEAVGGLKIIDAAVAQLNEVYTSTKRSFRIERVAGGYRVMTTPEFGETISSYNTSRTSAKLSQAALETLAIVAYRQPIIRSDVEVIRGVACGEVLRNLLDRHLIKITGRAEEVGRPMLYGTTKLFLETFGLASLKDLPDAKELKI